jgi:hypothetical protein
MSYAIFELDIRRPPITAHRHQGAWFVRCDRCGKRSVVTRLLSDAMRSNDNHAASHVVDDELALEEWLSTTRAPLGVHNSSPEMSPAKMSPATSTYPFDRNAFGPHRRGMRAAV